MDPQIWKLVRQLKEGEISQENLVDILANDNPFNANHQNKENMVNSQYGVNSMVSLKNPLDQFYSNTSNKPHVMLPLNISDNNNSDDIGYHPNQFPQLDLSAVVPELTRRYRINIPNPMIQREQEEMDTMEQELNNANTMRYQSNSANEQNVEIDERDTKRDNYNSARDVPQLENIVECDSYQNDQDTKLSYTKCTPQMMTKSLSSISNSDSHYRKLDFFTRSQCWQKKRDFNLRKMVCQKQLQDEQHCKFNPRISERSKRLAESVENVDRFYNKSQEELDYLKLLYLAKEEHEHRKTCTFRPSINPLPAYILQEKTKANIQQQNSVSQFEIQKVDQTTPSQSYVNQENKIDKLLSKSEMECVFNPTVNSLTDKMTTAKQYLKKNVVDRLYNKEFEIFIDQKRQRGIIDQIESFTKVMMQEREKTSKEEKDETEKIPFLERQKQHQQKKNEEMEQLELQYRPSFTPTISQVSRQIAPEEDSDIYERNKQFREKVEKNKRVAEISQEIFCKFTPEITSLAQAMPPRSLNDLCYGDSLKRVYYQFEQQNKKDEDFKANFTFKPTLHKNASTSQVSSRLGLELPLKDYIENYKQQLKIKDNIRSDVENLKLKKEQKECSFKPHTTKLPVYIQEINFQTSYERGLTDQTESHLMTNEQS